MGISRALKRRAVFLDRDGVLNRAIVREGRPYPPRDLSELEILPDVPAALTQLRRGGFALIVVTNQPDVARGEASLAVVEAINQKLLSYLEVDAILTCYHDDRDNCICRKPKPGLLFKTRDERSINLGSSFMVGDRWRDIEAGQNAGCRTVFIDCGYRERHPRVGPNHVCLSLGEAARWILAQD